MSASNTLENALLDHVFTDPAFSPPATLYLALLEAAPVETDTGSSIDRLDYTAYADVSTVAADWDPAGASGKTTNAVKQFPENTDAAAAETASHFAVVSADGGGDLYFFGMLATGQVPFFALASTDTLYAPGHTFVNDDRVVVLGSSLPGGLDPDVRYYAMNVSGNSFQVSTSPAGSGQSAVNVTSDGFGRCGEAAWLTVSQFVIPQFAAGALTFFAD